MIDIVWDIKHTQQIETKTIKCFSTRTNRPFYVWAWLSWHECIAIYHAKTQAKAQEWLDKFTS